MVKELIGKTVGLAGGAMYSQYRCLPAASCMVMNEGTEPRDCASSFVNPLTALGMVETMKMEGHTALVHTAASSNLGQMLVKICVNRSRVPLASASVQFFRPEIVKLLSHRYGAKWVVFLKAYPRVL